MITPTLIVWSVYDAGVSVSALRAQGWRVLTVWECAAQPRKIKALQTRLVFFLEL